MLQCKNWVGGKKDYVWILGDSQGAHLITSMPNSKGKCKTIATKKGGTIEDAHSSGMKVGSLR